MLRALGNAMVWTTLTVGLPGVLYAITMAQENEDPADLRHQTNRCMVCRQYRQVHPGPQQIEDENMILVSPAHPVGDADQAEGDRLTR